MDSYFTLPAATFQASSRLALDASRNQVIEDAYNGQKTPTSFQFKPHGDDFDDLYDISEDEEEGEEIQIQISSSVVNSPEQMKQQRRYPSIIIPSPTSWPKHNATQPSLFSPFSPVTPIVADPRAVSKLANKRLSCHSTSSHAPSLDSASIASEEISVSSSCPPTPELQHAAPESLTWNTPMQLNPASMMTLESITTDADAQEGQYFEFQPTEMQQVGVPRLFPALNTSFDLGISTVDESEPLSALTVPSPGGFFSSLNAAARNPWIQSPEEAPPTAVAENFYGLPFQHGRARSQSIRSPPVTRTQFASVYDDNITDGPPTAVLLNNTAVPSFNEEAEPEYNEHYEPACSENFNRTAMWLQAQVEPVSDVSDVESITSVEDIAWPMPSAEVSPIEKTPVEATPIDERPATQYFPKQAPKFGLEDIVEVEESPAPSPVRETLFLHAFESVQSKKSKRDAFIQRRSRSEKLRLDRKALFSSHVEQLDGRYTAAAVEEQDSKHESIHSEIEDSQERLAIATATREQNAIEQITAPSWNVEATKYLNGGTLLTSPTSRDFDQGVRGRVLDLGGVATADWAWQVATEFPRTTVHTVCTADQVVDKAVAGPTNHRQTIVPNLWTLPFPNGHFDCISARNVYAMLKTDKPARKAADEYDLCLAECYRVLRPGGYIEFAIMDADIINGGRQASAMSVEFAYNLKTRGYDPAPSKAWLSRLRRAGFGNVRRAWLALPMSQYHASESTTSDASHISGMVASWAWERWMLKLHKEMGREGDMLLEGVPAVLEEGARYGASWRCLSGYARKPF